MLVPMLPRLRLWLRAIRLAMAITAELTGGGGIDGEHGPRESAWMNGKIRLTSA